MSFRDTILAQPRPVSVRGVVLPRRDQFFPSPADWRDEVLYFLLPDRFSDAQEAGRPLLDRANLPGGRPAGFRFDRWAQGGSDRWQGGTLAGIRSKLAYLKGLGVTTLWVGPVFKQRGHLDTYHGYAIQDFLEVDSHFGTRQDLVDLVDAAHQNGLRVILDIIFNHSGHNWDYVIGENPPYRPWPGFYQKGPWLDSHGQLVPAIGGNDDGIWPSELQPDGCYTRAGKGSLGAGDINDPEAEHKRTDFDGSFRDFNYDDPDALDDVAGCFKYWIALTDCDGFRLDTVKHVSQEQARNFCGTIKEFAENLGKADFFLVAEVAGSDDDAQRYRDVLGRNLNATLDISGSRRVLHAVAKGLTAPSDYFGMLSAWDSVFGSHRNLGTMHVSILDDHDHVSGDKVRFSSDAASDHQVVAGVAIQLFSLGIPCVYYGTEQAFAGPEKALRDQFLPDYNVGDPPPDKYLREAMFGPEHPRLAGLQGLQPGQTGLDQSLPGFGPFGTSGQHCFDPQSSAYVRVSALCAVRAKYPVLRYGRQYERQLSNFGTPFALPPGGELIAWSRLLDDEEALCVVNGHGAAARGGQVVVDSRVNAAPGSFFEVVANSAQAATPGFAGPHAVGTRIPVQSRDVTAFVEIQPIPPSEVLVLVNRP
ncbi:MAG TPA: alpha-amylase family glycosyl hydrolase [Gemmataceae bacterium]|jgi:glycosidase|nr:alpha-amylase family glycosyl hydrolase [Gemmataceae bacterium]